MDNSGLSAIYWMCRIAVTDSKTYIIINVYLKLYQYQIKFLL
jgi:hypothetical protein